MHYLDFGKIELMTPWAGIAVPIATGSVRFGPGPGPVPQT